MSDDPQPEPPSLVGIIVGSYRLVQRLGAGGMGEVYAGEHVRIVRRVAVKFLLPQMTGNRAVVERLFAEASATSSIRHPGIVEIFDCDVDPAGRAYIVMELLAGESLAARLERDATFGLDPTRALAVAEQMASALSAAHACGIIHRDLKPDNVFVREGAAGSPASIGVKILDFGIAKLLVGAEAMRKAGVTLTVPGTVLGSPSYMSPEQCRDASNVDHRTDVYSLGCILFEMLCGRPPFIAETFAELAAAQLQLPPPSVAKLRAGTPPELDALVQRLLAKSPAHRPASMEEVRAKLAAVRLALERSRPRGATGQHHPAATRWSERVPRMALAAAALLAAGGGLAIALGHRDLARPARTPSSSSSPPLARSPLPPASRGIPRPAPPPSPTSPRPIAAPAPAVTTPAPRAPATSEDDGGLMTPLAPGSEEAPRKGPALVPAPSRRPSRPSPLPRLSDDARKL